jgi:hypothetical protein
MNAFSTDNIFANNITGTTFFGDGSNLTGISAAFNGGTVTGATNFTNGVTANTISATTYNNLPFSPEFVWVQTKSDLPAEVGGVITLEDNYTYYFTTTVDLTGDRLVCGINTTILGSSSENCRIKSTGLVGTALISSNYSLPMRGITIEADIALNLSGDGTTTAIDWFGVNFTDCNTGGTIDNYSNVIWTDCAILNSGNFTFNGTIGTVGLNNSLFNASSGSTVFILPSTLTITRRFRIIYSSFVVLSGEVGINADSGATIPTDSYILDTVNFAGGGTYLQGLDYTSLKTQFSNSIGITNSTSIGHYRMTGNTTPNPNTVANTFEKVLGTSFEGYGNSTKWVHTNGRLTYSGAIVQDFYIVGTVTLEGANTNQTFAITFGINGVANESEAVELRAQAAVQPYSLTGIGIAPFNPGDYIELFVKNMNNTNDCTITTFNVIITRPRA